MNTDGPWFNLSVSIELGLNNGGRLAARENLSQLFCEWNAARDFPQIFSSTVSPGRLTDVQVEAEAARAEC